MEVSPTNEPVRVARGGSQSDLRRHNERIVLKAIHDNPGLFNAELSRRTGLAAQTISVILRGLSEQGLIRRGPVLRGRRGQPATPISLNPKAAFGFGADIGWRRLVVMGVDFAGAPAGVAETRYAIAEPEAVVAQIVSGVRRMRSEMDERARRRPQFLGVATPQQMLETAAWLKTDLKGALETALSLPVTLTGSGLAASRAQAGHWPAGGTGFAYLHCGPCVLSGLQDTGLAQTGRHPRFRVDPRARSRRGVHAGGRHSHLAGS